MLESSEPQGSSADDGDEMDDSQRFRALKNYVSQEHGKRATAHVPSFSKVLLNEGKRERLVPIGSEAWCVATNKMAAGATTTFKKKAGSRADSGGISHTFSPPTPILVPSPTLSFHV